MTVGQWSMVADRSYTTMFSRLMRDLLQAMLWMQPMSAQVRVVQVSSSSSGSQEHSWPGPGLILGSGASDKSLGWGRSGATVHNRGLIQKHKRASETGCTLTEFLSVSCEGASSSYWGLWLLTLGLGLPEGQTRNVLVSIQYNTIIFRYWRCSSGLCVPSLLLSSSNLSQ